MIFDMTRETDPTSPHQSTRSSEDCDEINQEMDHFYASAEDDLKKSFWKFAEATPEDVSLWRRRIL